MITKWFCKKNSFKTRQKNSCSPIVWDTNFCGKNSAYRSRLALLGGFGGLSSKTREIIRNNIEQNAANRMFRQLTCEVTSEIAELDIFPHFSSLQCCGKDPLKVWFWGLITSLKEFTGPRTITGGIKKPRATPSWFPNTPKLWKYRILCCSRVKFEFQISRIFHYFLPGGARNFRVREPSWRDKWW